MKKKIALLHCPRNVTTLKVEGVAFRLGLNLTHCYLEKEKPFCNREKRLLSGSLLLLLFRGRRTTTRLTQSCKIRQSFLLQPLLDIVVILLTRVISKKCLTSLILATFFKPDFLFENVNKIYKTFRQFVFVLLCR